MRRPWFDRRFDLGLGEESFSEVVERIRGTPARLEERVGPLSTLVRTGRVGDQWSVQENVGHLLDLEGLWAEDLSKTALHPRLSQPMSIVDLFFFVAVFCAMFSMA